MRGFTIKVLDYLEVFMLNIKMLLIIFLLSACIPADKNALMRTNENLRLNSANDKEQSKQLELLTDIIILKGDLAPDVVQALKTNSLNLNTQSNEILEITTEETKREVGIFTFGNFVNGIVRIAEVAKPFMGAISRALGLPAGVGEGITALIMTGATAYLARRNSAEKEAQKLAHEENLRKEKELHEQEVNKLNERMEIAKRMEPQAMLKYDEIKKQVRSEKVT